MKHFLINAIAALFLLPLAAAADEDGMFDYAKAQIWLEPVSGQGGHLFNVDVRMQSTRGVDPGWYNFGSIQPGQGLMVVMKTPAQGIIAPAKTYAPVDVLMMDEYGIIVQIAPSLILAELKEEITSDTPVIAMLYLAGGAAQQSGIQPGDHVRYKLFKQKPAVLKQGDPVAPKPPQNLPWREPTREELEDKILRQNGVLPPEGGWGTRRDKVE